MLLFFVAVLLLSSLSTSCRSEELLTAEEHISRGNTHYREGRLDEAIAEYTKAIKVEPNNPGAYYNRAYAYANNLETEKAIADLGMVIRLEKNSAVDEQAREILVFAETAETKVG